MGDIHNWIQLDPIEVNKPHQRQIDGVTVNVLVPSYDVPKAVGACVREDGKFFEIRFKYDDEETQLFSTEFQQETNVQIYRAKDSKRLYRIVIDLDMARTDNAKAINIIIKAINGISGTAPRPSRSGNYELAGNVVREKLAVLRETASR